MANNPAKPMTIYDILQIDAKTYPLAFTTNNINAGFFTTSISYFNQNIFGDDEYLSSFVTERPLPEPIMANPLNAANFKETSKVSLWKD